MIVITLRDTDDGMIAYVNVVNEDGTETIDVSSQYTVKELLVRQTDGSTAVGWFVGKPCETGEWKDGE